MTRILIVDDEQYEREMLRDILESHFQEDIRCTLAANGNQAVELTLQKNFDIVLMDIKMPGINGIEAAKQILTHRPKCRFIFVTAYGLFSYAHEAVKIGACDYILKPIDSTEVIHSVKQAINQISAFRQLEELALNASPMDGGAHDEEGQLISRVKTYLQHNYMQEDLSLDTVSEILNINASYFSAKFKRSVGVNFVDYLTDLRVKAAKELLTDPLLSTAEIAVQVGYTTSSYFSRVFKTKTGMTPTEYRRLHFTSKGGILP